MVALILRAGGVEYALDAREVIEVVPWPRLRPVPLAPPAVAGLLNHHGQSVAVLDLSIITANRPSQTALSSRIILLHFPSRANAKKTVGLLAEGVTDMRKIDPKALIGSGVKVPGAPFLGAVTPTPTGMIQLLVPEKLVPPHLQSLVLNADQAADDDAVPVLSSEESPA